jgi:hypothetical protein
MSNFRHKKPINNQVSPQSHKPIVLVQNEVTIDPQYESWRDETGKQYHFPNSYINLIAQGRRFVYYRGARREGAQRRTPEYFGCGTIGTIAADPANHTDEPKRNRKWFAAIQDYTPFDQPVPFQLDGKYLENRQGREWGRPRSLTEETYQVILDIAGVEPSPRIAKPTLQLLPQIDDVQIVLTPPGTTIVRAKRKESGAASESNIRLTQRVRTRYSSRSHVVGRRAEEIAMKYFRATLSPAERATLTWVADEGEKPGWDVQYRTSRVSWL